MALLWDRVDFGNEDDVESTIVNFDRLDDQLLKASAAKNQGILFDTRTICAISSSITPLKTQTEVVIDDHLGSSLPRIHSSVSEDGKLCVAVGRTVITFTALCGELKTITHFDSEVECLSLSKDGDFLLVGCSGGLLKIIYIPLDKCLISEQLFKDGDISGEVHFSNVMFTPIDQLNGTSSVLIFLNSGKLFQFSNIYLGDIINAILIGNQMQMQEIRVGIEKSQWHLNCEFGCLVSSFDKCLHLFTTGKLISMLSLPELKPKYSFCQQSILNGMLVKVEMLSDGRFAFILDDSNSLHILCLKTFIIIKHWKAFEIKDFTLIETLDKESCVCLDIKLLLLVSSKCGGLAIQLHDFPSFQLSYAKAVAPCSYLLKIPANQDSILFIEGVLDSKNQLQALNVREITEAMPEARLTRLLNKREFDKALTFAKNFGLAQELIYRTKVNYLVEQLTLWCDSNLSSNEINTLKKELMICLDNINDVDTVVHCCLDASMLTLLDTVEMLLYAKEKLKLQNITNDLLKCRVSDKLQKLETFDAIFGAEYFKKGWQIFQEADLFTEFVKYVSHGKMNIASLLWDRHHHQMAQTMTGDQVVSVLQLGSASGQSSEFYNFVRVSFASSVLHHTPNCLEILMDWTISRCCMMEVDQKKNWPDNAIRFAEEMDNIFQYQCSITAYRSIRLQSELKTTELFDDHSIGSRLQTLLANLKDLKKLRTIYNCNISLADYSQENKMDVCCSLLKWSDTPAEIPKFIKSFLGPYAQLHDLNRDEILTYYVKNVLEQSDFDWWHWEAAPWERQIIAIIDCIYSVDIRLESVVRTIQFAPVPWSSHIEDLAKRSLEFKHPLSSEVKKQMDRIVFKVVLMKYGLQKYNVADSNVAWILINHIIKRDEENSIEDALTVAKFFPSLEPIDVYMCQIRHLISTNKYSEFVALLKSMSSKMVIICCKRLTFYVKELLWSDRWNTHDGKECVEYLRAAVHALNRLKGLIDHFDFEEYEDLLDIFLRRYSLQMEFNAFVTLQDLTCANRCMELFHLNTVSFLDDGKLSDLLRCSEWAASNEAERKTDSCPVTISRLYRLSTLLQLKREAALKTVAMVAFNGNHVDVLFDVLKEMSSGSFTPDAAAVLFTVVSHCVGRLQEKFSTIPFKIMKEMLELLGKVLSCVSIYCDPSLLERCVEISHFVTILRKLSYQNSQFDLELLDSQSASILGGINPYEQWVFTPIYKECFLAVDAHLVLNSISAVFENVFNDLDSDFDNEERQIRIISIMRNGHELVFHLHKKGHTLMAYHILMRIVSFFVKHGCLEVFLSSNKVFSFMQNLIVDILKSTFGQHKLDTYIILGLLLSLRHNDAVKCLSHMEMGCSHKYRKLMALAEIGQAFCQLSAVPAEALHFKKMAIEGSWGQRLARHHISFRDSYCGLPKERMRLAHEMIATQTITVATLSDYCKAFQLDVDTVMVAMLTALLTNEQSENIAAKHDDSTCVQRFQMCLQLISEIHNKHLLLETLKVLLEKTGEYDYECLAFVIENLRTVALSLNDEPVMASCQKGLDVLNILKVYNRVSKPSETELDLWLAKNTELTIDVAHEYIGSRLPFHALLGSDAWNIVCPELLVSTIDVWLEMAPIIGGLHDTKHEINDKLLMNAVRNLVAQVSDRIRSDTIWKGEQRESNMIETVFTLIDRIKNPTSANASANYVVTRLPPSYAKVIATEGAIALSKTWFVTTNDGRAESAIKMFESMHTKLLCEHILRSYGLERPQYLSLCDNPYKLIFELYHDSSVVERFWFRYNKYPNIHEACKEIASKNDCDLDSIFFNLLDKWLAPMECNSASLDDTIMDFNMSKMENSLIVDDDNLKRAIYLMKLGPESDNASYVAKWMLSSMPGISYEHKFRATICLLHSVGEDSIELYTGMTSEKLVELAKSFFCASQLEILRLPCDSVELDKSYRVQELVIQLLQVSHRNPKALELAVDLCIESNIGAPKIWSTILQRMIDAKMYDELSTTLVSLKNIPGIGFLPVISKAWILVLEAPPTGSDYNGIAKLALFHRCPSLLELDLPSLSENFLQMGLPVLAMDCLLHIVDTETREQCMISFLTPLVINPLLKQLMGLRESYGELYHLDRVSSTLASRLSDLDFPRTSVETELFDWIVSLI